MACEEKRKLMIKINQSLSTKESLKSQFISVLNNHVDTRDILSMMTSAKEKTDLIQKTTSIINLL
jgi:hypothetical protein